MFPDTLSNVRNLINSQSLSASELNQFIDLLGKYKIGDLLYPGVLIRKLGFSRGKVYDILDILKKDNILQINYEMYCHKCNQFEGTRYETFGQIPNDMYCERCDEYLDPLDNSIVIYRVMKD